MRRQPGHQRTEATLTALRATPTRALYSLTSVGLFTACTLERMARSTHRFAAAACSNCREPTSPHTCSAAYRMRPYSVAAPARELRLRSWYLTVRAGASLIDESACAPTARQARQTAATQTNA